MAVKTIHENPTISDEIVFDILTPDASGCFSANPYKVDTVIIYFVARNFAGGNIEQADAQHVDPAVQEQYDTAKANACANPSPENLQALQIAQNQLNSFTVTQQVYFNEATPVATFGTSEGFPAWLSTDVEHAFITNIPLDDDGNPQYGHFRLNWKPELVREGDFYICWTWTPLPAGDSLSRSEAFYLSSNAATINAIPTHYTVKDKYQILLERYLPEMFKEYICPGDLSPDVLDKFNAAIADGFTTLENLAAQIVDLQDANALNDSLLVLLGNIFDLKLKSSDTTRWRRQIKQAIPLFKRKGTIGGLRTALDQAGVRLTKLTRLWQVISPYTWRDGLIYEGSNTFPLSKVALPYDPNNFGLWLRYRTSGMDVGDSGYVPLDPTYVSLSTTMGQTTLTWLGDTHSTPIHLSVGDRLLVMYLVNPVPDATQQQIENYIRTLQVADQRDETLQMFPPKNWNVRVLEEDDPLFDVLIPVRHPYADYLIFGRIRTEFPYSENVYNMDEYNGSLRDSLNPCDIANDFLDPCSQCQGSKFSVDLEIQDLSNDRLVEVQDIIREFAPFHAVLHSLNFAGGRDEVVLAPVETIESCIDIHGQEIMVAGAAQYVFNRAMDGGLTYAQVKRNVLASTEIVVPPTFGLGYNDGVALFAPDVQLDDIGVNIDGESVLEVMAPSPNAGTYTLTSVSGHTAGVPGIPEPLNKSGFTFRLSNNVYTNTSASIIQDNRYELTDPNEDFGALGVKSQWDVDHGQALQPWKVLIPTYSANAYTILQVLPSGGLLLLNDGSLPATTTNVSYSVLTDQLQPVANSATGNLGVTPRGRVELNDPTLTDVRNVLNIGLAGSNWYLLYSGVQYFISGFLPDETHKFYIDNFALGTITGVTVSIYQRLADSQLGYVRYYGMELDTGTNEELALMISNGANPPPIVLENNRFMENFLIEINSQFYSIAAINGSLITLSGLQQDWQTLAAGGTPVNFTIYRFVKQPDLIQGVEFDQYDRRGKEIITKTIETSTSMALAMAALNMPGGNEVVENVTQEESITFQIEYADGTVETGGI
jgi:hypothetical protein